MQVAHLLEPFNFEFVESAYRKASAAPRIASTSADWRSHMTDASRRAAVLEVIRSKTAANTTTKACARAVLVAEGIYTKKGELRAEFREVRSGKKPVAA